MNNEPVAWAMFKGNTFMDAIHPDEHARFEGGYTIPLYTHPAKTLTDEEIAEIALKTYDGSSFSVSQNKPWHHNIVRFVRAVLKEAQEK
jgi:hypothetical protein